MKDMNLNMMTNNGMPIGQMEEFDLENRKRVPRAILANNLHR